MDLSNPIRSVIPAAQGEVLAVLARTEEPLSGRRVADLTDGRVSQKGVNLVLRALVAAGLVTAEDHPPAKLYRLNRRHLAANSVAALATLREQLIDAMQSQFETWTVPAWGAWLFGSAARGGGDATSYIDVLIVRPDDVEEGDAEWLGQLEHLVTGVGEWTGNSCEIVEYAAGEFEALMAREDRLAADLRSDGVALTAQRLPQRDRAPRRRR
ncbi:MAG TPA: hypothetical protein VGA13_04020 [Acidimicrobiales bacterium]